MRHIYYAALVSFLFTVHVHALMYFHFLYSGKAGISIKMIHFIYFSSLQKHLRIEEAKQFQIDNQQYMFSRRNIVINAKNFNIILTECLLYMIYEL